MDKRKQSNRECKLHDQHSKPHLMSRCVQDSDMCAQECLKPSMDGSFQGMKHGVSGEYVFLHGKGMVL